ncbi:MAG: tetratricopeptide repeat protein, partial [Candidatus Aminicenantes bacterium]|nr:tetratricopeptide repeat protein [Candidatus Aminicenantes bacterium]
LYEAGRPYLEKALELESDLPIARLNLAVIKNMEQEFDEAILHLNQVLRANDQLPQAYMELSKAYAGKGRWEAAAAAVERAISLDPDEPAPHYQLAQIHKRLGNVGKALEELQRFEAIQQKMRREKHLAIESGLQKKPQ